MKKLRPLVRAISAWLGLALVGAHAQASDPAPVPVQIRDDLAARQADVHWPQGYDPETAQLFAHNEILVAAPCSAVWSRLVNATDWPTWYANSKDVRIGNGTMLAKDTPFTWQTFGVPINSSVVEFDPGHRLGWFGQGPDMHAYHTWYLSEAIAGCHVITEEVTNGPAGRVWRLKNPGALHAGHDAWLTGLKKVAESH